MPDLLYTTGPQLYLPRFRIFWYHHPSILCYMFLYLVMQNFYLPQNPWSWQISRKWDFQFYPPSTLATFLSVLICDTFRGVGLFDFETLVRNVGDFIFALIFQDKTLFALVHDESGAAGLPLSPLIDWIEDLSVRHSCCHHSITRGRMLYPTELGPKPEPTHPLTSAYRSFRCPTRDV